MSELTKNNFKENQIEKKFKAENRNQNAACEQKITSEIGRSGSKKHYA